MDYNEEKVILRLKGICKSFPGVKALDQVNLTCEKGSVHVLLGENGAGKSTLVKIIYGEYQKDEGSMWYNGQEVVWDNVREAMESGIGMIHQELSLLPERTIAQNIYVGHEPKTSAGLVDKKKMIQDSQELMDRLGLDLDPQTLVRKLSIAQQQMVEVVKALSLDVKLLIMDEPTSSLTNREIDKLFEIVGRLKEQGVSIIYISHRMDEIKRVGDYVTVMRDGQYIETVKAADANLDDLIALMVGRKIEKMYERHYIDKPGEVLFETKGLTGLRFRNVSIYVRAGEIVSLSGLIGAGRTEVVKAAFGYDPIEGGSFELFGKPMKNPTPSKCIKAGMGLLPENRKEEGLVLPMTISENMVEASLGKVFPSRFLSGKPEKKVGDQYVKELRVATPSSDKLVEELSGGNQQKVVIGKWLETGCRFLVFDEPTRGIDVGAKSEIYRLMDQLVQQGYGILMISSEMQEVIGVSDRVYVMKDGEVTAELQREEFSQENILRYAI